MSIALFDELGDVFRQIPQDVASRYHKIVNGCNGVVNFLTTRLEDVKNKTAIHHRHASLYYKSIQKTAHESNKKNRKKNSLVKKSNLPELSFEFGSNKLELIYASDTDPWSLAYVQDELKLAAPEDIYELDQALQKIEKSPFVYLSRHDIWNGDADITPSFQYHMKDRNEIFCIHQNKGKPYKIYDMADTYIIDANNKVIAAFIHESKTVLQPLNEYELKVFAKKYRDGNDIKATMKTEEFKLRNI